MIVPELRPYQSECIRDIKSSFMNDGIRRQLLSLPTGAGKTLIQGALVKEIKPAERKIQVIVVEFRNLVLEQTLAVFREKFGLECELEQGENRADPEAPIIIASQRSLVRRLEKYATKGKHFLFIFDEAHNACTPDCLKILRHFGALRPAEGEEDTWESLITGWTATPIRSDGVGLDQVFDRVTYHIGLTDLVKEGYLVRPVYYAGEKTTVNYDDIDLVTDENGFQDYDLDQIAKYLDKDSANQLVVDEYMSKCKGLRTLVFCYRVENAERQADLFRKNGVRAISLSYKNSPREISEGMRALNSNEIDVICNVDILSEGVDSPYIEAVIMNRPTISTRLVIQQMGRALRLCPETGKKEGIILDLVHNFERHDLCSIPKIYGLPLELIKRSKGKPIDIVETVNLLDEIKNRYPDFDISKIESRQQMLNMREMKLIIACEATELVEKTNLPWLQTDSRRYSLRLSGREFIVLERDCLNNYEVTYHIAGETSVPICIAKNEVEAAQSAHEYIKANHPAALRYLDRNAEWRTAKEPTGPQMEYISKNQLEVGTEKLTRGRASDLIREHYENQYQNDMKLAQELLQCIELHESLVSEEAAGHLLNIRRHMAEGSIPNGAVKYLRKVKNGITRERARILLEELSGASGLSAKKRIFCRDIYETVSKRGYISDKVINILLDFQKKLAKDRQPVL